eukprot:scaffold260481_cov31-Tisochrysis_lutea.AAC.1
MDIWRYTRAFQMLHSDIQRDLLYGPIDKCRSQHMCAFLLAQNRSRRQATGLQFLGNTEGTADQHDEDGADRSAALKLSQQVPLMFDDMVQGNKCTVFPNGLEKCNDQTPKKDER